MIKGGRDCAEDVEGGIEVGSYQANGSGTIGAPFRIPTFAGSRAAVSTGSSVSGGDVLPRASIFLRTQDVRTVLQHRRFRPSAPRETGGRWRHR